MVLCSSGIIEQMKKGLPNGNPFSFGAPWGIRTPDLLVRSQTLYPAGLRAHTPFIACLIIISRRNMFVNGDGKFFKSGLIFFKSGV